MKIRILFFLTFFLFVTVSLFGQCGSTTVNFTITDSDTQVWSNATITANLYNPSHTQVPVCTNTGQKIATSATVHTNGSGHGSMTLTGNTLVSPAGTGWIFTMQPQTSGGPSVSTSISINPSGTQDLSTILSSETVAPRINPSVVSIASAPTQVTTIPWGYNDTEFPIESVVPFQNIVGTYYNVVMQCQRYYDLLTSSWYCGTSTTGPQVIQVNGIPITTESPANFQDTTNAAWTNPSAGNIKVTVSGGGSIIPPNPSTTNYVIAGDSRNLVSNATATPFSATAATCGTNQCTVTATNTLVAGDWVGMNTGFDPTSLAGNPYFHQVISATGSSFVVSCQGCTGSGVGGSVYYSSYVWPLFMASLPYFNGHGTVLNLNPTGGETIENWDTSYTSLLHPLSPAVTGNPAFLFIPAGIADVQTNACFVMSLTAQEAYLSVYAKAHTDGYKVVQVTIPANAVGGVTTCGDPLQSVTPYYNQWFEQQPQTQANTTSGQYWNYIVDPAAIINSANSIWVSSSPHFSDIGNVDFAKAVNDGMMNNMGLRTGLAGNGQWTPNLNQSNQYDSNQNEQLQSLNNSVASLEGWGVSNSNNEFSALYGFNTNDDKPGIWIGENGYAVLIPALLVYSDFSTGAWDYAPLGVGFGFSSDQVNTGNPDIDVAMFRNRSGVANTIDVGNGTPEDKTGNMEMGGIGIGTPHIPGHAFDCSGTGCPGAAPAWVSASSGLSSGFVETYPCTVSSVAQTCIHERINTGLLNNGSTTTVSLIQSIPNGIMGDPVCSDNSGRVQGGNTQPVGANFVGGSAPFSTFAVWVGATSENAMCDVYGW